MKPNIFLGVDLNSLPEEMKVATARVSAAYKRYRRAEQQFSEWQKEHELATDEFAAAQATYGEVSLRWDPESNTMKPGLEECPKS